MKHPAPRARALRARLVELARMRNGRPFISVYLNAHWLDDEQRERIRVFLKEHLHKARASGGSSEGDLSWIEGRGAALIEQPEFPNARGLALFAGGASQLRDVFPLRAAFANAFVVADAPFLRPLAAALEDNPPILVVFVDTESARLIPVDVDGTRDEVSLEHYVPGHHRQGGWALLAQSRYQRHIQDHRDRHLEAVAETLARVADAGCLEHIVLAGESRAVSLLRSHVSDAIGARIVGHLVGSRYEPANALVERATALLARVLSEQNAAAVDRLLDEAAKAGQAVAGLEETLEAVNRGSVHRLYLIGGFHEPGAACEGCAGLQPGFAATCRMCGAPVRPVELGAAMVNRVIAAAGGVTAIANHSGLATVGGVAALLRYPL